MDKPNNYFNRTYVINLPERTDRFREVTAALERIGMPLSPGKVEVFPALRPKEAAGFSSAGIRGCFLSHLAILKQALDLELSNVLIFEDDVEFASAFTRIWPSILTQLTSQPWSFAYLGYNSCVDGSTYASPDTATVEMRPLSGSLRCAHAYAVSRQAISPVIQHLEEMLQRPPGHPEGGPMDVDGAFNVFRRKHPETLTLIAEPQVAWQRASQSDLHSKWYAKRGMRILLWPARKVKNYFRQRRR
ncbi:glycosyltransferase family 25 protein [Desulfococcaceae bacterium HSG7]|nr:glycosyltransferase family 25 protein [Desulfococcaceae bacterium HSG7]